MKTLLILVLFFFLIPPSFVMAEFVKTGAATYQHTNLQHRVVITEKGILFMETEPMPIQLFDPASVEPEKVRHAFLAYNASTNRYNSLTLGANSYRVNGSFNLRLGKLLVKVDQNNPYISFVVDDPDYPSEQQGILGVIGLTVVVNTKGDEFLTLLQANNDFGELQPLIKDYQVQDGMLLVDGHKIPFSTAIGIASVQSEESNPCLSRDSVVLTRVDLEKIRIWHRRGGRQDLAQAEQLFKTRKNSKLADNILILRVDQDSVAGLDFIDGSIKIIKQIKTKTPDWQICLIEEVAVE